MTLNTRLSWEDIRRNCFSLDPKQIYMNNSSFGATLNSVALRMQEVQKLYSSGPNMDRWVNEIARQKQRQVDAIFGELVNAPYVSSSHGKTHLVGTVNSVTEGMSMVANGIPFEEGDVILTTDHEHAGGKTMWDLQENRHKAKVVMVDLLDESEDSDAWQEALIQRFTDKLNFYGKKVKVVSFSWITFSTGHLLPVDKLCDLVHKHGAISVVDGAQAFGVVPMDFQGLGADFLVVNGHKYLNGPIGSGFICMQKKPAKEFWPTVVDGHSSIIGGDSTDNARCKKGGVGPYTNLMSLHEALIFYRDLGPKRVHDRLKEIGIWLRHGLTQYPDKFEVLTPTGQGQSVSMTCVRVGDEEQTKAVYNTLKSQNKPWNPIYGLYIEETDSLRIAPHYYNTSEELNMLADALCNIVGVDRRKWPHFETEEESNSSHYSSWSGPCGAKPKDFGLPVEERHCWPLCAPFQVMSTLSKLVFYGSAPGFHHGLDLRAAAGTPVHTPVGGVVMNIGNYYPNAGDYAYEIAIMAEDKMIWKFHHVDQSTVPPEIKKGAEVNAGQHIADIYDPAKLSIKEPPHVHIEILGPDGHLYDPLNWLPLLKHTEPPILRGLLVVDGHNRIISELDENGHFTNPVTLGKYELILDIIDFIPPVGDGDAVKELRVCLDCREIHHLLFDRLPYETYMKGADEAYKIAPVIRKDGACLANFNVEEKPNIHLYRCGLNLHGSNASSRALRIMAQGYAGNILEKTFLLQIAKKSH